MHIKISSICINFWSILKARNKTAAMYIDYLFISGSFWKFTGFNSSIPSNHIMYSNKRKGSTKMSKKLSKKC